jgi:hypothetical protein
MLIILLSTALLWHSLNHIDAHGPKSTHARTRDGVSADPAEKPIANGNSGVPSNGPPSQASV